MGKTGGNERNTKERWRNTRKKRRTTVGVENGLPGFMLRWENKNERKIFIFMWKMRIYRQ